jgi:LacI family transcriptional regulator
MRKVNLKDLALELGVSISTVSKALRDSYEIGDITQKKIIDVAKKMGYSPNPYAGFLRNHKSKTIAIIAPELNNNFFIQAISGAEAIAQDKDYHILVYSTHENYEKEKSILHHLQNGRVDGVIMSIASTTKDFTHINELIQSGIPIIFFDRICHEIETIKITTDDFVGALNATEHLIQNGCKRIAYLSISDSLSIDYKRKQGYLEALNKYHLQETSVCIVQCTEDDKNNLKKIKQLLLSDKKIDGIFASVEKLALTTYHACSELDITIPEQVKVICFSNLATSSLLQPTLSTVTQPAFEMGKQAAKILFNYLEKKKKNIPNEHIVLKSQLIKRDSSQKTQSL